MADIQLTEEEKQRLEKIDQALSGIKSSDIISDIIESYDIIMSVCDNFNGAAISQAFTAAENREHEEAFKKFVGAFKEETRTNETLHSLKMTDVFMGVARRVANNDKKLAALLPKKLGQKEAEVLEKCELKSLAAVVRAKL